MPNHNIRLNVGAPVMILRDLDQNYRLCNSIRLVVKHIGNRIIDVVVVSDNNVGIQFLFPR